MPQFPCVTTTDVPEQALPKRENPAHLPASHTAAAVYTRRRCGPRDGKTGGDRASGLGSTGRREARARPPRSSQTQGNWINSEELAKMIRHAI